MLAPPSFALAYRAQRETSLKLEELAGNRLRTLVCGPNNWLFDQRVKSEESALSKLQLGRVRSLGEMRDLYAATVVVPTPNELPDAIAAIEREFPDAERVQRSRRAAQTFQYDDIHLIATLGKVAPGLPAGLRDRPFEVQVRTGLQYAWWRATHDVLYKGSDRSWRLERMASQIRASLELLDAALGNLRGAADLLPAVEEVDDSEFLRVLKWLDRWPAERRPADERRFCESVLEIGKACGLSLDELEQSLLDELIGDSGTTPFQAVLGSMITEHGAGVLDRLEEGKFVLVTAEFESACAVAAEIPAERRASASPDS